MIGQRYRWLTAAALMVAMLCTLPVPSQAEVVKKYDPALGKQDLLLIGFGELTLHAMSVKGNKQAFETDNSWLESDFASNYRASLFANGNLSRKLFVNGTAIVDSRVEDEYRMADPSLFRLKMSVNTTEPLWDGWRFTGWGLYDPQRQWELANLDTRLLTQPQQSSRLELQARLESDKYGFIEGGSLKPSFKNSLFTLHQRSLFGSYADLHSGPAELEAVAGKLEGKAFREGTVVGIRADGTSGPYDLAHVPVTRASEQVKIEIRDRYNETMVLESRTLTRDIDYTVDYLRGRITLHQPVASETTASDPVYIVITYDYQRTADDDLAGARVQLTPVGDVEAGVSMLHRFIDTEATGAGEDEPQNLYGGDLTIENKNLGNGYIEMAGSDNPGTADDYTALRAGWRSELTNAWRMNADFMRLDDRFRSFTNSDLNPNKNQQRLAFSSSYDLTDRQGLTAAVTDLRGLEPNGLFNTYDGRRDEMVYSVGYRNRLTEGLRLGLRLERRDVLDRDNRSHENNRRQRAIVDIEGTRAKLGVLGKSGAAVHYELMALRDYAGAGMENTNTNQVGVTLSSEPSSAARIELTQRLRLQDNCDRDLTDEREDASFASLRVKPHRNLSALGTLEYKRLTAPGTNVTFWQDDPLRIDKAGTVALEFLPAQKIKTLGKFGRHQTGRWGNDTTLTTTADYLMGQVTWFSTHHLSFDAESEYRRTFSEGTTAYEGKIWDLGLRLNWNRDRFHQIAAGLIRRWQMDDLPLPADIKSVSYILLASGSTSLGHGFFARGSFKEILLRNAIDDEKSMMQVEVGYEGRPWYRVSLGYERIESTTDVAPDRYYRGHGLFVRLVGNL